MGTKIIKDETLQGIADAIRAKTGTTEPIKTSEMSTAISGISAGGDDRYDEGFSDGKTEGVEEGKQAEYDRFWNAVQENGERTDYGTFFMGNGWVSEAFKPKYVLKPINARSMFNSFGAQIDLREHCILDMSQCTDAYNMFTSSKITNVGVFDLKNGAAFRMLFENMSNLESIEKIIFYPEVTYDTEWAISRCQKLKEVRFEGEFCKMKQTVFDLSRQNHSLSKASIESLIDVLSLSSTGLTVQILRSVIDREFATAEGANDGSTSDEWNSLVATKQPSWTISLV